MCIPGALSLNGLYFSLFDSYTKKTRHIFYIMKSDNIVLITEDRGGLKFSQTYAHPPLTFSKYVGIKDIIFGCIIDAERECNT